MLDEPLVLAGSMCRSVRLYGCHLPGVHGAWLASAADLHLRGCRIDGEVDLTGAYVGRQLVLSASRLCNSPGVAVRGDGLVVAGDLLCRDHAVIEGEFRLVAARIGGELRFTNSTLLNPGRVALRADRIAVEKNMYCREEFRAVGQVRLRGGHIKGQLNFNNATLSNPGQVALDADQLVVGGHLYCQESQRDDAEISGQAGQEGQEDQAGQEGQEAAGAPASARFEVDGEISLVAARVGGEVRFSAARLTNPEASPYGPTGSSSPTTCSAAPGSRSRARSTSAARTSRAS